MSIKAVLVDFGNVIGWFDHQIAFRALANLSNSMTPGQVEETLKDLELIQQLETGLISSAHFLTSLRKVLDVKDGASDSDLSTAWSDIFTRNEPVIRAIKRIPGSVRVVLSSNTADLHFQQMSRQFGDAFDYFSAFVCSDRIQVMKPAPEFYQACVDQAQCRPQECLYFDDIPEYVEAASKAGIQGVVYTPDTDFEAELVTRGIQLV